MNKLIINTSKKSLAYLTSTALITIAAALTISGLAAQSSSSEHKPTRGCTDWPHEKDRAKVEAAFDKVLKDSASPNNSSLRNQLLDTSNCYEKPRAAVQKVLDSMSGDKVAIPETVVIIFYQNDTPRLTTGRPSVAYPSDHCLHIFFLPEVGAGPQDVAKTSFRENLMCCYKP